MIIIKELTKIYKSKYASPCRALDNVDFRICPNNCNKKR